MTMAQSAWRMMVSLCLNMLCLSLGCLGIGRPALAQTVDEPALVHSEKSLYRQVFVYEDKGQRCLCFTHQCSIGRQSCIDLLRPQQLVFEYTQMMLAALFLNPRPTHILVIGLGGGTLPMTLQKLLPDAQIDAVEIDPAVVRVAQRYFGFREGDRLHVAEQDGRAYIRQAVRSGRHFDLVMLDAYENQYIPEHMLTKEFLEEVRSTLEPGGIVAANTFSMSRLYSNESVTYQGVFGSFYNLKRSNRIILATNGPLPPLDVVRRNGARYAEALARMGSSSQTLLDSFTTVPDWDTKARVLTDQYSPANLLNVVP
jgi:spermidine synthase